MTYVACAYDQKKNFVITVQTGPIYTGPGKPTSFAINLPRGETYYKIVGIAESVFGKQRVRRDGKNKLTISNATSVSDFLVNVAGLAKTLDMKLGS